MRIDLGLEVSVDAFVDAVTEALVAATASLPSTDPDSLRASVVTEAFNISCAFIDADGLATDDELWGLIRAFGSRLGPEFARAVPDDLRRDATTAGAQKWALTTSDLFEILLGVDRRDHTDRATTYYTHAMALAHTVASLDTHTGRDELLALDAYRTLLLTAIKAEPGSPTPRQPPNLGPQGAPEHAGSPQVAEQAGVGTTDEPTTDPPARDLDELLDELDALVGLAEVKREVRLVANLLQVQRLRRERGLPVVASSRHLDLHGQPRHRQDHGRPAPRPDLPDPRRGLPGPPRRERPLRPGRGVRRPDRHQGHRGVRRSRRGRAPDRRGLRAGPRQRHGLRPGGHRHHREAGRGPPRPTRRRSSPATPTRWTSFVEANPGLPSRFPRTIAFPDYTDDELIAIFDSLCTTADYRCDAERRATCAPWPDEAQPRGKGFGNGRLSATCSNGPSSARPAGSSTTPTRPTSSSRC